MNARANMGDTNAAASDKAMSVCPVGALLRKRVGYAISVGQRQYDSEPIGSDIEAKSAK